MVEVRTVSIDSLNFPRPDLIKMDVEGMEMEALAGAAKTIAAHRPILVVEVAKVGDAVLRPWLEQMDYTVYAAGMNFVAIHKSDKCHANVTIVEAKPAA